MSSSYVLQQEPFVVPTTDGKLIEEHFGRVISNEPGLSIAHMVAPSGWSEPFQNPEFDEYTMIVRGRKQIEIDGEIVTLKVGESLLVRKGARVRYSNPFEEEAEYWSVCVPAFSIDLVNREENSTS
ncbi:MAG: cupin domain-containing protein [SAR324 cluster bacterium]|jgi:mannose-6-phosphate isomerase-like protein (cupin superfamily)|nr:cupin domain-containing protein [SAR324 cluster bacterium]RZO44220.1 MAG: cupin domain-containing protein [Pseudomonadota bacterium]HBR58978.1 cupin [Deltaproteobacteria bacterium]MDG2063993.1 cupin domain-containing protein [SAR324 cluster bacterium]MDP6210595.1 cupin domain-containing protein [SAR324 cluster bacterium]|tara:strand:+ start:590 stop:967 length:378 start_codon:yes stop_codon:yes gene_type:complete